MANIKISRKEFEKDIGKLNEEMQHKIAMLGTPLESFNDEEIELEIFPNRPDMLSYQGFKRAFLGFLGKEKGLKPYKINKPEKDFIVKIDPSVKNIRPFTACAIVKNLTLTDSRIKEIIDIQEKLHNTIGRKRKKAAIGVYPLDKISLPITFQALEPDKIKFLPLESEKEMSGLEILQRHPTGKEYAHLLAGKTLFPIFTDSKNQILSMPPVINSELTGKVTSDTHDVFVECSGSDFETQKKCLNIILATLADMGGSIYQMELKYSKKEITPNFEAEKMKLSIDNASKLLGIPLNEKTVKESLERMGYNYKSGTVEIPPWRTDILHEVDLIEDIAIAYGYDNFNPEIPKISTTGEEDRKWALKRKISDILSGLGLLETKNYYLTTKDDQLTKMGKGVKSEFIEVKESKTDYTILRKDLTHYLLKTLSNNVDSEYPQKIYETGEIFTLSLEEKDSLGVALSPSNFTEAKQTLDYMARMLNIKIGVKEPKSSPYYFIEGRVGEIFMGNTSIGFIGEIHPKTLKDWKIKMPVSLFEISLEEIFKRLV